MKIQSYKKLSIMGMILLSTIIANTTELKRDGWNLIAICQDINRSNIDMNGIEEIQNQNGKTIYTGVNAKYSNLNRLEAGYGYWIKGNKGIQFDSKEANSKLEKPLLRKGWNLMASCESLTKSDINMSNVSEIQSQEGETIYTGEYANYSNLDTLLNGYGYWVDGNLSGLWTAKRGLTIPINFDYQTINNRGEVIEGSYNTYRVELLTDFNQAVDARASHTGVVININNQDIPIMQIQEGYVGHNIVVAIYDSNNQLVLLSDIQLLQSPITTINLTLENGGGTTGCTELSDTHANFIVAQDNNVRDLSKEFNGLTVSITTNGSVSNTSQGTNAIFGTIDNNPTNALFKLNTNYASNALFVVKVYSTGKLVGISDEVTFNAIGIVDFAKVELVECP